MVLFSTEQWLIDHGAQGVLTEADVIDMKKATARVFELLSDLHWHDADEIRAVAGNGGVPASEGLRRLRDLRKPLESYNLRIIKHRPVSSRSYSYKLISLT